MDWCVKPYDKCNHEPVAACNGSESQTVLQIVTDPGANVKLTATGSSDPDGDNLSYKWWVYREAGSYSGQVPVRGADTVQSVLAVPKDASGRTIHVILEVVDDGKPSLTAYRRVILKVSGEPVDLPAEAQPDDEYLRTPITKLSGPPSETGKWAFYRGINLNGPAIEIDGNKWEGDDARNFVCEDRPVNSPSVRLKPPTDEARAKIIYSFRWNRRASIMLMGVPGGRYAVYAYVWEDNNPETFSIWLNERVVARDYYSGVEGQWRRLGPWIVTVTDGTIKITSSGGAANFSGIELYRSLDGGGKTSG